MSTTLVGRPGEIDLPEERARLRGHVALVRALLDEIEHLTPICAPSFEPAVFHALNDQLAEEVGRLGCRMLECAAAMTGTSSKLATGQRANSEPFAQ